MTDEDVQKQIALLQRRVDRAESQRDGLFYALSHVFDRRPCVFDATGACTVHSCGGMPCFMMIAGLHLATTRSNVQSMRRKRARAKKGIKW